MVYQKKEIEIEILDEIKHSIHPFNSTSRFLMGLDQQNKRFRAVGQRYNPDVAIPQSPLFRVANNNIDDPYFREMLFDYSSFLRTHTLDPIEEILREGWDYVTVDNLETSDILDDKTIADLELKEIPEWSDDLKEIFVRAASKALIVDTAFINRMEDGDKERYFMFTSNNVVFTPFINRLRQIEEVYFLMPTPNALFKETRSRFITVPMGFLTQHSDVDVDDNYYIGFGVYKSPTISNPTRVIKRRNKKLKADQMQNGDDKIYRSCVVITPYNDISSVYGVPKLIRECQTALLKEHLRFMETVFLAKGGTNKTTVINSGKSADFKESVVRQTQRGMKSMGTIITVNGAGTTPVSTFVDTLETAIPDLKFDILENHLNEDGRQTKQAQTGGAETGAMGGQAPIANERASNKFKESFYPYLASIIKDVNDVFFGISDKDSYKIKFRKVKEVDPEEEEEEELPDEIEVSEVDPIIAHSIILSEEDAIAHSINTKEYITFEGNMFQAGIFKYPESKFKQKEEYYSPEDIKKMANRPVKSGYMEYTHSGNPNIVGITEGIGYYETIGFDEINHKDKTLFHLEKKYEFLADKSPEGRLKLRVSPLFNRRNTKNGKDIYIKNVAIIPKEEQTRAEFSGLDTSATKI